MKKWHSYFFNKVRVVYMLKTDLTEFFWKKSCFDSFVPKVARKEPKMRFFIYYWKSTRGTFLIFCIKQHWLKDLKFTQVIFIRKSFVLKFLGHKGLRPKWGFSSFVKNQCMDLFWFFAWSCNSWKGLNWLSWFF